MKTAEAEMHENDIITKKGGLETMDKPLVLQINPTNANDIFIRICKVETPKNEQNQNSVRRASHMFVNKRHDEAAKSRKSEWEYAVSQDTHALEKRNGTTQQLCIQRHSRSTTPNYNENCSEYQRRRISRSCDT
jgi:hypothetical protein